MKTQAVSWKVLLIGGPSGAGKTVVARQLGQRLGISWMQVDDLRLALLRSQVRLPEHTDALYFFQDHQAGQLSPEQFREGLIAVGQVMLPAIEVVVENHVDTDAPTIIEGDAILPSLVARPEVRKRMQNGQVQAVFLVEPEEQIILSNMLTRGRGIDQYTEAEARTEARAKWLYGQWLTQEAQRFGLPVLKPRPWETLIERIEKASHTKL
jgi:2-phosphoglycerate kinase